MPRWKQTAGSATLWAPVNQEAERREGASTPPCQQGFISRETKGEPLIYPAERRKRRLEGVRKVGGRDEGREVGEEISRKVILNFCPEMIFSHRAINIYLISLLALLDLTV